jgi:hypothetical protein
VLVPLAAATASVADLDRDRRGPATRAHVREEVVHEFEALGTLASVFAHENGKEFLATLTI